MIPRTFPSILGALGETKMVVYVLPSVSGLQAWKDYIPVKGITTENTAVQNTYANDGYQVMSPLEDISTKQAWKDYIPVFEDASYTKAWSTDAGGYIPASGLFSVYSLFSNNEQGVWYDPSDLTTLFQDAAGTTPVTAVEQPVGLLLDKSKNGVGTNGTKRVNLWTYSEEFDNAGWTKDAVTISSNQIIAPDGTLTADKLIPNATTTNHGVRTTGISITAPYTQSVYAKAGELSWCFVGSPSLGHWIHVNLATGAYTLDGSLTGSVQSVGNGWYRISVTVGSVGAYPVLIGASDTTNPSSTGNGTSGIYIWGAQLEVGSTATAYQKITDTWYNTLPGNHAYQTTSANRPTLSARYNLLTKTEQFDDAAWNKANSTVTANSTNAPDGTATAEQLIEASTTSSHYLASIGATMGTYVVSGNVYTYSIFVKKGTFATAPSWIQIAFSASQFPSGYANFNLDTGAYGTTLNVATSTPVNVGNGWWRIGITATATSSATSNAVNVFFTNNNDSLGRLPSYAGSITSDIYIWGADLRVANDGVGIPAYQRVNTATDYDTVGFPLYLRFDGVDDFLQNTLAISTLNLNMWVGHRETGNVAAFSRVIFLGDTLGSTYQVHVSVNGATPANSSAGYRYPENEPVTLVSTSNITRVVSYQRTSTTSQTARLNGVAATPNTQATTTFTSQVGRIGSGVNSSFLTGRFYGAIIRGAATSDAQLIAAEKYMNSKTKAY